MTKTYSSQSNAIRAAKKELGAEAVVGADFHLNIHDRGRFSFTAGPKPEKVEQPKASKAPRAPKDPDAPLTGKAADLVAKVRSDEGITTKEVHAMTGWTKIGGFYGAVKRAGLVLHKVRDGGDTRYFGAPVDADAVFAYIRHEPDGVWARLGVFGTEADAINAAPHDYAGETGKNGGFFVSPRASLSKAA